MLSLSQPLVANLSAPAYPVCAKKRKSVVAPTEITFGSLAGEPMVFVGPASPVETVIVTPAATAALSNSLSASRVKYIDKEVILCRVTPEELFDAARPAAMMID